MLHSSSSMHSEVGITKNYSAVCSSHSVKQYLSLSLIHAQLGSAVQTTYITRHLIMDVCLQRNQKKVVTVGLALLPTVI